MPNRLIHETSPYLLQHAENPVDWYPWGPEAMERARREGKPIFLSIGYSACHWCHVMERESFEDEEIAKRLNEYFVCIKVDREERPDVDQIYMNAVQLMTGRGGWPLSVFLTPDMTPFFGGTYWPPRGRMGMPGFDEVLQAVHDTWSRRRDRAEAQAEEIAAHLRRMSAPEDSAGELGEELLEGAAAKLRQAFDFTHGGFGDEPKFPHPLQLRLLLRISLRRPRPDLLEMVSLTLDQMARGGIYDHLAGGFARYTVDARWLVPHFEKMLYDNALLAGAYLDGFLALGRSDYARVARETLDYLLAYMADPEGGFHGTEDADSEGEEGKFYLWTPEEVQAVLGDEAAERFCYVYDVTESGNFEGRNILNLSKTVAQCAALRGWGVKELTEELSRSRAQLLAARDQRPRPGKDDKVLVSWNALAIEVLARAAAVLEEPRFLQAAERAARFLLRTMRREDGRLLHCWRKGEAKYDACLDDYAYLIDSLVTLYESDFQEDWIDAAVDLADQMLRHFSDKEKGGFYYTADDHETLIARNNVVHDGSTPSGNAMAASGLWRLGKLCGRADYLTAARDTLKMAAPIMGQVPLATGQMLAAADMALSRFPEIVLLGDLEDPDTAEVLAKLRAHYWPNRVIACRPKADLPDGSPNVDPIFLGKDARPGATPALYVCEGFACRAPALGKEAALAACDDLLAEAGIE